MMPRPRWLSTNYNNTSTKGERTMPLTQDKRFDGNISNNNDSSYLHKKFKKMASTISVPQPSTPKGNENFRDANIIIVDCNKSISNGSISACHPEIEKIKENREVQSTERNVQTNFNDVNFRLSGVNNDQISGKTSYTNEFFNKTENIDNVFVKDNHNGTVGRYVCPYCKLSCAKPSVLQKHIRAHTNERPYPCVPCGFAFKTKSNLYKHRRSRTHALRLQGADVSVTNEDELSPGSESDNSLPPTSASDAGSDVSNIRTESLRPNEYSSPELSYERVSSPIANSLSQDGGKWKSIYKPKFRAAFYQEADEKEKSKKSFSPNADFLNEHISKIISDNEAIVDVIETPLQKKYGKIKQIAESKQMSQINENIEVKSDQTPLNLTKNFETESSFRKRSLSDTFSNVDFQKHPLNPEGSIIKDLLLKTKANGTSHLLTEGLEGIGPLYSCSLCQISYRSEDNLEKHRMVYCKGSNSSNNIQKDSKSSRPDNIFVRSHFVRSNSVNVKFPETQAMQKIIISTKSPPLKSKPDNLVIIKTECPDVIAPLPSPGPLLGNTRLVDSRIPSEYTRKNEIKSTISPKRRIDSRSDTYSPRLTDNISPRSTDSYSYSKIRCVESNSGIRSFDDLKSNSNSLQMFGGEVKIVDNSGGTTTLRIEPSKNQLSPILVQPNLSPNKHNSISEASIIVRSGLHSGGTMVHNTHAPKSVSHTQTPRVSIVSTASGLQTANISNLHDIPQFPFPTLNAITAYNPLTLPPLSPSTPNGATSILHGGKLIPHVPGIPGPNTPLYAGGTVNQSKNTLGSEIHKNSLEISADAHQGAFLLKYDVIRNMLSPNTGRLNVIEAEKYNTDKKITLPIIKVRNVDETSSWSPKAVSPNLVKQFGRHDGPVKRGNDGSPRTSVVKDNLLKSKIGEKVFNSAKSLEIKSENEIRHFNFETMITKAEIFNNQIPSSSEVQKNTNAQVLSSVCSQNERSETSYFQKNNSVKTSLEEKKTKFLRPSTLPLKPGTFTPKKHHGITPNANTMPLVSPETPRPAKAYGQLYLNGNAYTYLGLKCSAKVFYCTINRPQPTYVPNQRFLSMYSNWQLLSELTPDPLGLSTSSAMSLYDSRHRPQNVAVSKIKQDSILTHSSQWNKHYNVVDKQKLRTVEMTKAEDKQLSSEGALGPKKELAGGFESNEEYTYIRGRGRGRYVCSECGIRCKKPSMLKKHIRTHTDVRPYTCTHCAFSFKTKGNLTKHMKSKAHYKKCCELGINPNEGNDAENGDVTQCSGETDEESDSDGDEGNEGETESSDTETFKSRLPEHEAAHCLLSLGGSIPTSATTPGLITSARPSTYPYTPIGPDNSPSERPTEGLVRTVSIDSRVDSDNEPMDLSKTEVRTPTITEIPTARESSVLASLASNTAKLPQQPQWSDGEPMLHAYLTERALLDSKIKQSQLTSNSGKHRKNEPEKPTLPEEKKINDIKIKSSTQTEHKTTVSSVSSISNVSVVTVSTNTITTSKENTAQLIVNSTESRTTSNVITENKKSRNEVNAENAKYVVSEYLKHARVNSNIDLQQNQTDFEVNVDSDNTEDNNSDPMKIPAMDHDPVARKVVIGAGGVAFKVKGKEFENSGSYSPRGLMEDGRRVCDFCNKTFTKPSQLRLHLNIHYMERPFRCSACAVSFRTKGHLQKHERSGSHHNKVSMTSTFGAATSLNPRPFRCSDCNIAFRIHGHLAKHLRSKMHVMRLECLCKLPFGTYTEIERAGVSLTDIDTTDCASSLASLQSLARKLHEMDPTKLEYRDPSGSTPVPSRDSDDEDEKSVSENKCDSEKDSEIRTTRNCDSPEKDTKVMFSATDN